jgi:cytidylate kinase
LLNGKNINDPIRSSEISALVSLVAVIPEVRTKLVDLQRQMGTHGGIVMDGRDIGTVVFPQADLKIFVTADLDIRAHRRFIEMRKQMPNITLEAVKANLSSRDEIDTTRAIGPLKQAEDAILFDTGLLTRETQLEKALSLVHELLAK